MGRYGIEINNHEMTYFPKFVVWNTLFQRERERERERDGRGDMGLKLIIMK